MSEILLIRHGQSENNARPEQERVCDPGLTPLGVKQADVAAEFLASQAIDFLYCSPFRRALETTRPIAEVTKLAPQVRPDIFEVGGCYSGYDAIGRTGEKGLGSHEIARAYPGWQVAESISEEGWWGRPFESHDEAWKRAETVSSWFTQEVAPKNGVHAFVIHADFKHLLISALLRSKQPIELEEPLYNVGVTRMHWSDSSWEVRNMNSVDHFSTDLITS